MPTPNDRPFHTDPQAEPPATANGSRAGKPMDFGPPISVYSRAQAIADGTLIPVDPELAAQAGFAVPVALTRAVFEDCVAWATQDTRRTGLLQDEIGRLWDVLSMAALAGRRAPNENRVRFQLYRVPRDRGPIPIDDLDDHQRDALCLVTLVLHCGPGDAGEPVLTILQPHED
jgi:hypothetical protein